MNIFEAFAEIEPLPANERLLIGVSLNEKPTWSAGSIDDPDVYLGFGDAVTRAIEEFRTGDRLLSVMVTPFGGGHFVVAMGPESAQAIIKALTSGMEALMQHHTS